MKYLKNKKGSFVVFITLVFLSITIFLGAVLKISSDIAIKSSIESLCNLFSQNVLSEYDYMLKERYGIFAVKLNDYTLEEKIKYYLKYSVGKKSYINVKDIKGKVSSNILDGNIFINEISNTTMYGIKPNIIDNLYEIENNEITNHIVSAKWIINELPSHGECIPIDNSLISDVSITEYLFIYFKDYVNDRELGKTYFNNEIEYIITGELNDEKARKKVYTDLVLLRNTNNLIYLYSCDEKKNAALSIATVISPEFSIEIQALLLEAWAYLEARNDLEILYEGGKVPLLKDDNTWALTLDNVIEFIFKGNEKTIDSIEDFDYEEDYFGSAILPHEIKGLEYDDYLKTLLLTVGVDKKVYRLMDIIQLNMKYLYDATFLFKEYVTSFEYEVSANGKKYSFEASY